jgi:hypothetical protein
METAGNFTPVYLARSLSLLQQCYVMHVSGVLRKFFIRLNVNGNSNSNNDGSEMKFSELLLLS